LYPLALDALGLGKISVGPPYFDSVFMPLMAPAIFLMGIGPMARWKAAELPDIARRLRWALGVAVVAAVASAWLAGGITLVGTFGLLMAFWIVAALASHLIEHVMPQGAKLSGVRHRLTLIPRATYGMMLAHLGVAVFCFGVAMVKSYEVERDVKMAPGDTTTVRGYTFTFRGAHEVQGPNYVAMQGVIEVTHDGRKINELHPEKRLYRVQQNTMTEAAIDTGFTRDLYVALGEGIEGGQAWIVRIYLKPFIDWIWGGAFMMALGGLLAATDRRYRAKKRSEETLPANLGAAT
jgi:cytochrome c-type biogenesis protein CcmF